MVPFQLCINTTPHPRRLNYKGLGPSLGVLQLEETLNPKPYTRGPAKDACENSPGVVVCLVLRQSKGFGLRVQGFGGLGFRVQGFGGLGLVFGFRV